MRPEEPNGRRGSRKFTRRDILALGAAGAGLVAFTSKASGQNRRQPSRSTDESPPRGPVKEALEHRGSAIRVERANGRDELYIDDEHIRTLDNTGEYRAAGFMFSPEPTLAGLAKNMVDARIELVARGFRAKGKKAIP